MTEPITITRLGLVPDGAGGWLPGQPQILFSGMASQKPRYGDRTMNGYVPYLTVRREFTFYCPPGLEVRPGDVVRYRGDTYGILSAPIGSEDRMRVTLYTEKNTPS